MNALPQRYHVIGAAGAGKTVFASLLAARLGLPHIELDALHWGENWQEPDLETFQNEVAAALAGDAWVVDGNYSKVRQVIWERVQVVVWLDYPLSLTLWRLLKRSLKRVWTRELLWGKNRETLRGQFLERDSLFLYNFQTFKRRRLGYARLAGLPEFFALEFVRLRSPQQAEDWLDGLSLR